MRPPLRGVGPRPAERFANRAQMLIDVKSVDNLDRAGETP